MLQQNGFVRKDICLKADVFLCAALHESDL